MVVRGGSGMRGIMYGSLTGALGCWLLTHLERVVLYMMLGGGGSQTNLVDFVVKALVHFHRTLNQRVSTYHMVYFCRCSRPLWHTGEAIVAPPPV